MEESNNHNKVINLSTAMGNSDNPYHTKFGNYKPNDELLQSTTRIKNQRDVILERIQKMEDAKDRVTKSVYDKVKRDYGLQLQTITELLNEKKDGLKNEIKDLYVRREKLSVEINRHKDILEEAEFRHFLGEFSQNQFQEVQNYETKEIEKLETDLSIISQFIRDHENLFDPQDLDTTAPQKSEVTKTVAKEAPATQKPQTPPPAPAKQPEPEQPKAQEPEIEAKEPEPDPEDFNATSNNVEIEDNDFEDLFKDDDSDEQEMAQDDSSNIDKIVESDTPKDKTTKPDEDFENYFSEEDVDEVSFTAKKTPDEDTAENTDSTPKPQKLEDKSAAEEIKTSTQVTSTDIGKSDEDSISDILDSIKLDEQGDQKTAESDQEKSTADIPLEKPASEVTSGYYMRLIEGELDQDEYPLKENISIGRSSSNDIVLKAPKVSRQHAAINMYNNQYIIIDLKSSNGVYVNGTKVDETVLNAGDEVSVGGYKFIFDKK